MIHVIASIHIKEGHLNEYIDIFKANIPQVLEEKGCVEYAPTVDFPTGLAAQELNADVVTIVEKWDNLDALRAHMVAPHMQAYHKKVKDIVERVTVKVLERA